MNSRTDDASSNQTDPYDELPEAVQQYYSRDEYLWLSDNQKARLIESETEPEWT
ncbi:MAG: hypothetical protein ABTQ25_02505 [Nitrosomonas ureae]